jgi:alkaline phosphatase
VSRQTSYAAYVKNASGYTLTADQIAQLDPLLEQKKKSQFADKLALMINAAAGLVWTTTGHDGVDVNIYASADNQAWIAPFEGARKNIVIGNALSSVWGLSELQAQVTTSLATFDTVGHDDGWTNSPSARVGTMMVG